MTATQLTEDEAETRSPEIVRVVKRSMEQRGIFPFLLVCPEAPLPEWYAEAYYLGWTRSGEGATEELARAKAITNVKEAYQLGMGLTVQHLGSKT